MKPPIGEHHRRHNESHNQFYPPGNTLIILLIGILLLGFLLFLISCSNKETNSKTTKLTFVLWADPYWEKQLNELVKTFDKEHPGVQVQVINAGLQYYTKLQTMWAGGIPPDVVALQEMTQTFAEKGTILNLQPYIEKEKYDVNDFLPKALDSHRYKGNLYALPDKVGTVVLYYNKDMFDKAGVPYPNESWTWDTFLSASKKLTRATHGDGKIDQYGYTANYDWPTVWLPWVYENGGELLDESGTKCMLNKPESVEALQFLADLLWKYKVMPNAETADMFISQSFVMGKVAMYCGPYYEIYTLKETGKNINWDIAPLPMGKKRVTTLIVPGLAISKNSKNPELAWELLKFLVSPQMDKLYVEQGRSLPPRISLMNDSLPLLNTFLPGKNNQVFMDSIEYARPAESSTKKTLIYDQILLKNLESLWFGKESAKEVTKKIADEIDALNQN